MSRRIWELDALRGICILGMVLVHGLYDLGVEGWLFDSVQKYGGIIFFLLSGCCATLGHHPIKRGIAVFACGLVCTAATVGLYMLGFADKSLCIWFGVLHCLGLCMILWPLFSKFPKSGLWLMSVFLIIPGLYLQNHSPVSFPWTIPLGLTYPGFSSADYFPVLPFLGFFLLGAVVGRQLYSTKQSLLPSLSPPTGILSFLCACGRHSLPIYLLHQPIFAGALMLLSL